MNNPLMPPTPEYIMTREELDWHKECREAVIRELTALLGLTTQQQRRAHTALVHEWYLRMFKVVHENEMRVKREEHEKFMRGVKARMQAAGIDTTGL